MKKNLYINDINIGDYGIYISSDTYLNAPLIDYTEFQVPARDGNLILDNKRLNNVIRKFDCYIPDSYDLEAGLNSLKKLIYSLRGYQKIVSDYDPDVYQYGYFAEELNVEPFITKSAQFSLYFSCLPQQWFFAGELIDFSVGTPLYSYFFKANDDPIIQNILAKTKNNYTTTYGWIFGSDAASGRLEINTTYHIENRSQKNKQYIVLLDKRTGLNRYEIIAEVDNYNFDVDYTVGVVSGFVSYMIPVTYEDVIINSTYESGYARIEQTWKEVTNTDFTNNKAFGSSPIIIYSKVLDDNALNGQGVVDLISINGNVYSLDWNKMLEDYSASEILSNYGKLYASNSYLLPIKIDFYENRVFILDNYDDFDANEVLDISHYFIGNYRVENGDSISLRFGILRDNYVSEFISSTFNFCHIKMGWWKL